MRKSFLIALLLVASFLLGMNFHAWKTRQEKQVLLSLSKRLKKMESLSPDLGDSMRELQLEIAKLWYAYRYWNKPLALYELKEIKETIQTVGILKPVVNKVDVSGVLDGMDNSQIEGMKKALLQNDRKSFLREYKLAIQTCNECHRTTGVGFNQITIPVFPPVPNQDWQMR